MTSLSKRVARLTAAVLVAPAVMAYRIAAAVAGPDRAFTGWSQSFALIPGTTGIYVRQAFYRCVLDRLGEDASIGFGSLFSHPTVEVGRRVYLGPYCIIGAVTLEDDVLVGSQVSITNGSRQHGIERLDIPIREQPGDWPRVTIGRDSWIGDRAIVMANVGEQCVVGAGAVVTKPLPARSIAVGNPARVVRIRGAANPSQPPESNGRLISDAVDR